jgi:hypothetical protein
VAAIHHTFTHKQYKPYRERKIGKCGPCPVFASYTLAFAVKLRKKHGKPSVRVKTSARLRFEFIIKNKILYTSFYAGPSGRAV